MPSKSNSQTRSNNAIPQLNVFGIFQRQKTYRSASFAVSCLVRCGFLICFDLNFNLGPLFEACFLASPVRQSVLDANLPIQKVPREDVPLGILPAVSGVDPEQR